MTSDDAFEMKIPPNVSATFLFRNEGGSTVGPGGPPG